MSRSNDQFGASGSFKPGVPGGRPEPPEALDATPADGNAAMTAAPLPDPDTTKTDPVLRDARGFGDDEVVINVPADPSYAHAVRLLATSLGADVGLSVDELDDLRIAVNEAFMAAVEVSTRVTVVLRSGVQSIDATVRSDGTAIQFDVLAASILRAVVGEVTISHSEVRFTMYAAERNE